MLSHKDKNEEEQEKESDEIAFSFTTHFIDSCLVHQKKKKLRVTIPLGLFGLFFWPTAFSQFFNDTRFSGERPRIKLNTRQTNLETRPGNSITFFFSFEHCNLGKAFFHFHPVN